ncbi:MAG: hypothetical protein ABFE16_10015 [Armatimonadia bacterium]
MKTTALPPSVLTKSQTRNFGPVPCPSWGEGYTITAAVRYDDRCGNGHNTFGITASIRGPGDPDAAGGCLHNEIAGAFPSLAPLVKWHGVSSDGPLHYLDNAIFLAGERDCHGLLKGEFRQHLSRGKLQAGGIEGVPLWELVHPEGMKTEIYAHEKPAPVTLEWQPYGRTGEGKARELASARVCACWPEATDEELMQETEALKAALLARLPALLVEFKAAVESLGFTY